MNGKLAALAEQAGYFIKFERTGKDVTVVHTKEPGTDGDLALFAELIVRECVNRATWAQDTGEKDIGGEILKHFGVEE
jgi:hypothetical protein